MDKTRATIVVPTYNEAKSIAELGERVTKVLDEAELDWTVLFVDDGSSDGSFEEIEKLHQKDARFRCLRFTRNFGSHIAVSAGLEHAEGDCAIVMMSDLEEPPEDIPRFLEKWREGNEIVWGIRASKQNKGASGLGSAIFHKLFVWLAEQGPDQSDIGGGFFLADKLVLEYVRKFPERNRNIIALLIWAGFTQTRITYTQAGRKHGKSKWSLAKKVKLALDTFVGFSSRPLRLMFGTGAVCLIIGLLSLILVVVLIVQGSDNGSLVSIAELVCIVTLIVGAPFTAAGLLGEYIARTLDEGRKRPLYVVRERVGPAPREKSLGE